MNPEHIPNDSVGVLKLHPVSDLRRRAEERLKHQRAEGRGQRTELETARLVHELEVHQIELEVQNEELRRARQELEASCAKYFELYDLAPVGYAILGEQDLILEVNLTATKLLGVERSRVLKRPVTSFIVREDQDIYCRHRKRLFETSAPQACELRMAPRGGTPLWVRMEAAVTRDNEAGPLLARVLLSDITERKQAEKALQASDERYRLLAETSEDMIYVIGRDDRVEYVNTAAARALGQPPQNVIGKARADFFSPETADEQWRSLQKVFESGEPLSNESRIVFPHGERWINAQLVPFRREGGKVTAVMGVSRDLTEHKQAEADHERLAQSERLAQLMNCANDIILLVDEHGSIVEANERALGTYGYSLAELRQKTVEDLCTPESRAALPYQTAQVETDGRAFFEAVHQRRDGSAFPVEISARFLQITGIRYRIGIFRDITQRKQVESRLRESERRLQRVIENINDALIIDDVAGRLVYANRKFFQLFGIPEQELDSIVLEDYVAPEWRQELRDRHDRRVLGKPVPEHFEYEGLRHDGVHLWLEVSVTRGREKGRIVGTQSAIRDITERKQAEQELRMLSGRLLQAQEEERRRIGKELHDSTSQELAAVVMSLSTVEKRLTGVDEETKALVSDCLAVVERSARDVRDLSHLLHPPFLEEVGLLGALRQHLEGFRRGNGIIVNTEFPESWARLSDDAEIALYRVAQEALSNVRRHSGSPTVTVRLRRTDKAITLEVADQGHGLAGGGRRHDGPDVGMGIPVMRERLRHIGGKLEIESSAHGTTVRAVLRTREGRMSAECRMQNAE